MKAIILAAGRGSRMKELTEDKPKCVVKLHGKRLIDWQLEALRASGIESIAIVKGYLKNAFVLDLHYFENKKWSETNMVVSLLEADSWLRKDTCIISYSDIVYSTDAVLRLKTISDDIGITYDKNWLSLWAARFNDPLSDAETFKIDNKGFLTEVGKKPKTHEEVQGQFMGLLKITPCGWEKITQVINQHSEKEKSKMDVTKLLQKLIEHDIRVSTIPIRDAWYEVDNEEDLAYYSSLDSLW